MRVQATVAFLLLTVIAILAMAGQTQTNISINGRFFLPEIVRAGAAHSAMSETAATRIWGALQDGSGYIPQHPQAFAICAIIIIFLITTQFESVDASRFNSRFISYSSFIRTGNIAGRLLINVAMAFFIVINLVIFWLLCLFPSVFVGLTKVYSPRPCRDCQ